MLHTSKTETVFGDGAAVMTFSVQGSRLVIVNWSPDPRRFGQDFWDEVREWFRTHSSTIIDVQTIMTQPAGAKLAQKLNGDDVFSEGKVRKTVIKDEPAVESWSLGAPESELFRSFL